MQALFSLLVLVDSSIVSGGEREEDEEETEAALFERTKTNLCTL
jgi:hypothetical protein